MIHDVLCEFVPSGIYGLILHDPPEGDDGDLCRPTAYIDDHVSLRRQDVYPDADSCGHRLVDHIYVTSPGVLAGVTYGTYLYLGAPRGDTDDHTERWGEPAVATTDHADHATDHVLGSVEVGDHTLAQWTYRTGIGIALFVHLSGLRTHGDHLARTVVEGHDRGLIEDDLVVLDDDGIGCAEVHG